MTVSSYDITPILLTISNINVPLPVNIGLRVPGWIVVDNESPYYITILTSSYKNSYSIKPQTADKIQVSTGDTIITIIATLYIPQSSPSSQVNIHIYPYEDPGGDFPMSLSRQTSPVLPTAVLGYSAANVVINTGSSFTAMNIFNPGNSNRIYYIYSAQWTQTGGFIVVDMYARNDGIDNNLSGGTITGTPNHDIGGPASTAHVTFFASSPIPTAGNFFVTGAVIGNNNYDMIGPPDNFRLHPGQNLMLVTQTAPANGTLVFQLFKWIEQ